MEPLITIKNLSKSYGNKKVLKNISLDIYPGQVIGYIGPNGAGKSTTVKILTGLIPEFEGEVIIDGFNLATNPLEIKREMGYVPENAEMYDVLTPMEYLNFIGKLYEMPDEEVNERAIKILGGFGLSQNLNDRMTTFSKGMRQKVLLASGLIHNPRIIVLDEPLSGLDANTVILVKDLITRLAKEGKTLFYCSHMMDVVEKVSDRILLINKGEIIADGTFASLKQHHTDTLEQVFSNLTGSGDAATQTDAIMGALS